MPNATHDQFNACDLAAPHARIVSTADVERVRVARDLREGPQQSLVNTVITLKLALKALEDDDEDATALVAAALEQAQRATGALREVTRTILPSALVWGGLRAALEELAARTPVRVVSDVSVGRLPATVEAAAYSVVAESLAGVVDHGRAESVRVIARLDRDTLHIEVRDDGERRPGGCTLATAAVPLT